LWHDINKDGIAQPGEPPFPNVVVVLQTVGGTVVATQTTNSQGQYGFTNLPPGQYVVVLPPSNFVPGGPLHQYQLPPLTGRNDVDNRNNGQAGDGSVRSGVVDLVINQEPGNEMDDPVGGDTNSNLTVDFGFYIAPNAVTLQSFTATKVAGGTRISWTTLEERNTLGFYVYRAAGTHAGNVVPAGAMRVNPVFMGSFGSQGGHYEVIDSANRASGTYSYYLVEIEVDGKENVYGPVRFVNGGATVFLPAVAR
jgi:hypothetical protein